MNEATIATVHSLMIPLYETVLLLPNASVAEIIGYIAPETVEEDAPPWMLGYIRWRGYRLPLVSYEAMAGKGSAPTDNKLRIAIFNGINNNPDLPFYGVLTQGIPRLLRANQRVVHELEDGPQDSSLALAHARVRDEAVVIPDLSEMESMLATIVTAAEQA